MKLLRNGLAAVSALVLGLVPGMGGEPLVVAATHPLIAELAREVGGDHLEVIDLMEAGADVHHWEPRPSDLREIQRSDLILAAGKGLEIYLPRLRDSLAGTVRIADVGETIPSLRIGHDAVFVCCPHHAPGSIDPHWWQSIDNMKRAARIVADELAEDRPDAADEFRSRAADYVNRLDELKSWARIELAKVPRARRKLVTAHNAFAYFAHEFGYEVIAVAGLSREQSNAPQDLARTIETIRRTRVPAVFPEKGMSARQIESLAAETGVVIAPPLVADGTAEAPLDSFEAMTRHNVETIVAALVD